MCVYLFVVIVFIKWLRQHPTATCWSFSLHCSPHNPSPSSVFFFCHRNIKGKQATFSFCSVVEGEANQTTFFYWCEEREIYYTICSFWYMMEDEKKNTHQIFFMW